MSKVPQTPADFEPMVRRFMQKANIQVARVFDGTDGEAISDELLREHLAPLLRQAELCVKPYFHLTVGVVQREKLPHSIMIELVPDSIKALALVQTANKVAFRDALLKMDMTKKPIGDTFKVEFPFLSRPGKLQVKEKGPAGPSL